METLYGPFRATEALDAGFVTRYRLKTDFEAIHRNVYIRRGEPLTAVSRAIAAWLWSDRQAVIAGRSAAAVLGSRWIDDDLPAELNRSSRDKPRGIVVHSDALSTEEITSRNGMRLTTPARTAYDIGRGLRLTDALIHLDALARATGFTPPDVDAIARLHTGARGIVQLRRALLLMDGGSESPYETRTRLALINAGLPRPQTQIVVEERGAFVARIDMGWKQWRVGVEFDGAQHWTDPAQRTKDIDRLAELEGLGWRIIRVSASLLRNRPWVVVARVYAALRAAGAPV